MAQIMKDAQLKREVQEVLSNCDLDEMVLDKQVYINIVGDEDDNGNLLAEKEIDVVVKFTYRGQNILLLFECEDTNNAKGIKKNFKDYAADIQSIHKNLNRITVIESTDGRFQSRHFRDVDIIRACFVYGSSFPQSSYQIACKHAEKHGFLVWNRLALTYYKKVSGILRRWSRYELFKDFDLELESTSTFTIRALEARQKDHKMYFGTIHPGQLLKIAYVVRRASEKKYAYQRMLNKDRIDAIGEFIASDDPQGFLPNSIIIVFDEDAKIMRGLRYDPDAYQLTIPLVYCSAWVIDGQHRAYGFLGTKFENWEPERFHRFDLPVIAFRKLPESVQTQTFININYYQKRIKAGLVCDLTTLTKDLHHKLTWPSLLGHDLNYSEKSPLKDRIKISELHSGRSIGLSSLVQYGLLETLLGFKPKTNTYSGPLFDYARFNPSSAFDSPENKLAFARQFQILVRYLEGVRKNTVTNDPTTDPWSNTRDFSLLRPTGINSLFLVLAKVLHKQPIGGIDFNILLKPLRTVSFKRNYVAKKGGGWKGFRGQANTIIRRLNKGRAKKNKFSLYGKKDKV